MTLSSTATFMIAFFLLSICITPTPCDAFRVTFDKEKALGYYRHSGYRQYPHWIIGVWGRYSGPAVGSGNGNVYPTAQIHLQVTNPPHDYFQFVIYDANKIEKDVLGGIPDAHPCMYRGQRQGIAKFDNMSKYLFTEQAFGHGTEIVEQDGSKHTMFSITGDFILQSTGLYVMTINSCAYDNTTGNPVLNLHGWENTIINGYFSVRNPYGYLPGELYGCLPGFAVLFACIALTFLIYAGMCFRMCFKFRKTMRWYNTLLSYHFILLAILFLSFLSYAIFVGYYNTYNKADENKNSTFVAAVVFLKMRDALALGGFFWMCYGVGITQPNLPRNWKIVVIICLLMNFICTLAVYSFDQAIEFNAKKRGGEEDNAEDPTLSRGAAIFAVVLSTGILVLSSIYYLAIHVRRLNPKTVAAAVETQQVQASVGDAASPVPPTRSELQARHEKYMMYLRTSLVTGPILLIAMIWAFVQARFISSDGIEGETPDNWKAWWAISIVPQIIYSVFIVSMAIWWGPIPSSRKLRYMMDPSANLQHDRPEFRDGELQHRTYVVEEKDFSAPAANPTTRKGRGQGAAHRGVDGDGNVDYSDAENDDVEMQAAGVPQRNSRGGITIHFQRTQQQQQEQAQQQREANGAVAAAAEISEEQNQPREHQE